ncbi:MAG: PcfB family protein [Oscillospiraceae bacterium]|nr:PcfB family protein [Oscillospiraceae bacterium]
MTDQDQINEKNCCLIIRGGTLTSRTLARAMQSFLHAPKSSAKLGKQSIRQLAKSGAKLENIPVGSDNIKDFERVARKYSISFAVRRDISEDPLRHLVFFKSRDADSMTAAFREFSAGQLGCEKERLSLRQALQQALEKVQAQVLTKTRTKEHER